MLLAVMRRVALTRANKRKARSLTVPDVALEGTILGDEVQNVRAFPGTGAIPIDSCGVSTRGVREAMARVRKKATGPSLMWGRQR